MDLIFKEIDKCQVVCIICHHKITTLEQKLGFTRIKTNLTRMFNKGEMSEEDYIKQKTY